MSIYREIQKFIAEDRNGEMKKLRVKNDIVNIFTVPFLTSTLTLTH